MNLNEENMKELKEKATKILNESEDKADAIFQVMEMINSEKYKNLVNQIVSESKMAEANNQYYKSLNLRVLSKEETKFYEQLKNFKQELKLEQDIVLPKTTVDLTLEEIKNEDEILKIFDFTPSDVKKWIVSDYEGTFSWEGLTEAIEGQLEAGFDDLDVELAKLSVFMYIPKAICDLALPFVDKYFRAVLNMVLKRGLANGGLVGTGKKQPIGYYKQIDSVNEDGTHKDKEVHDNITGFSPSETASVKNYLSKDGDRDINKIYLVCNPSDKYLYVDPARMDSQGNIIAAAKEYEVLTSSQNPKGKALFLLDKKYKMGFSGFKINQYDQTKALEDVDVLIGKAYANGRAVDDESGYVFDVTKLKPFVSKVIVANISEINSTNIETSNQETPDPETPDPEA